MTRKDFKELAQLIKDAPLKEEDRRRLASSVASLCKRSNNRFDTGRFLAAAGV